MSEVQGSILVIDERFLFSFFVGKISMIAKKILSVAEMASTVYETETYFGEFRESEDNIVLTLFRPGKAFEARANFEDV